MNNKQPAITIYQDGSLEQHVPIFSGQLRRLGQMLIERADSAMIPPTDIPQGQEQPGNNEYVPETV